MTVTLNLNLETEADLLARADAEGLNVSDFVQILCWSESQPGSNPRLRLTICHRKNGCVSSRRGRVAMQVVSYPYCWTKPLVANRSALIAAFKWLH